MSSMLAQARDEKRKVSFAEVWDEFCADRDWELSCPITWSVGGQA